MYYQQITDQEDDVRQRVYALALYAETGGEDLRQSILTRWPGTELPEVSAAPVRTYVCEGCGAHNVVLRTSTARNGAHGCARCGRMNVVE